MKLIAWFSSGNAFGEVLTEEQIFGSWPLHPLSEGSPTLRVSATIKATEEVTYDAVAMKSGAGKCGIVLRRGTEDTTAMAQGDNSVSLSIHSPELQGYLNLVLAEEARSEPSPPPPGSP